AGLPLARQEDALDPYAQRLAEFRVERRERLRASEDLSMTYIIVDLEATCSDRGEGPREEMEIIEIGAIALFGNGPHIKSEYQSFVKPVRHPELTRFCRQLTHISQDMVASADALPAVLERFGAWIASFEVPVFCSWGDYDKHQLRQDCAYHDVPFPFGVE